MGSESNKQLGIVNKDSKAQKENDIVVNVHEIIEDQPESFYEQLLVNSRDNETDQQLDTEYEDSDADGKERDIAADAHKINEDPPEKFSEKPLVIAMNSESQKQLDTEKRVTLLWLFIKSMKAHQKD